MDGSKQTIARFDGTMEPDAIARALVLYDRAQGRQSVLLRSCAALCITCAGFGATGMALAAWQAAKRPVEAYVVTTDTLGRYPEVRPLGGEYTPSRAMVADRLRSWIVNVRRRPADMVVLRQQWLDVTAMTLGQASRDLQAHAEIGRILQTENTDRVTAEFTSAQQMSDGSWLVRWRETVWQHEQQIGPAEWSALITTAVRPGATTTDLARNPLGIYVTAFQWAPEGVTR